jgi:transcriptional regulator with XRE-family HTH domain
MLSSKTTDAANIVHASGPDTMPVRENSFGRLLRRLREARGLSLRELGVLSTVDHAYIQRLETGEKESPSPDVVDRLVRHLKADEREGAILRLLSDLEAPQDLVDFVLADKSVDLRDFQSASQLKYRGRARAKWAEVIGHIRAAREAIERG